MTDAGGRSQTGPTSRRIWSAIADVILRASASETLPLDWLIMAISMARSSRWTRRYDAACSVKEVNRIIAAEATPISVSSPRSNGQFLFLVDHAACAA